MEFIDALQRNAETLVKKAAELNDRIALLKTKGHAADATTNELMTTCHEIGRINDEISKELKKTYISTPAKPEISPIILALADWVKGKAVSGEVLYTMQQFGFIYPDQTGQLMLTPSGKQTLREHGLV